MIIIKASDYGVAAAIDEMKDRQLDEYLAGGDDPGEVEGIDDDRKYDEMRDNELMEVKE